MDHISEAFKKSKLVNNVINVNINNTNNDSNGILSNDRKYALDRDSFKPHTEKTQLAEQIAVSFDDLQNYAFYLRAINKLGVPGAYTFWDAIKQEIEEKRGSRFEIGSPKKYFAWKFREGLYR